MTDLHALLAMGRPFPLPGDADAVAKDAAMYQATADAIDDALTRMKALASPSFSSEAVSALSGKQDEVAGEISRAWGRYRNVGDALATYAMRLRNAQDEANRAIAQFEGARSQVEYLAYPLQDMQNRAAAPGPDQALATGEVARLSAELDQLGWTMTSAVDHWQGAVAMKNLAAKEAAIHVHRGNELDDLNDDWTDDIGDLVDVFGIVAGFARSVLQVVARVLATLATVTSVLSTIIPQLGLASATLYSMAQVANLAAAMMSVLQSVFDGANLLDATIATVALTATTVAGVLAAGGAAAALSGATQLGDALGVPVEEMLGDTGAFASDQGGAGQIALSLGGTEASEIYARAATDLNPQYDRMIGIGVTQAMGTGDSMTGWVGDSLGKGGLQMPGGIAAGATAMAAAGPAGAEGVLSGYGESPASGLLGSMAKELGSVYITQADGKDFAALQGAFAAPDAGLAMGDVAAGISHDLFGRTNDWWAGIASHAAGGDGMGVSAVGGTWDGFAHAIPDALGATGHTTSISDALDVFPDDSHDRFMHYTGQQNFAEDPAGGKIYDLTKVFEGFSSAIELRRADNSLGSFTDLFGAHSPDGRFAWS